MNNQINNDHSKPHWQAPEKIAHAKRPQGLWRWLCETGSLTNRIRQQYGDAVTVRVLNESMLEPETRNPDQALLSAKAAQKLLCREVIISADGKPLVFARTLVQVSDSNHWLLQQGENPLGDTLFAQAGTQRKHLQVAHLLPTDSLYKDAVTQVASAHAPDWARRSVVYSADGEALLIVECFYTRKPD